MTRASYISFLEKKLSAEQSSLRRKRDRRTELQTDLAEAIREQGNIFSRSRTRREWREKAQRMKRQFENLEHDVEETSASVQRLKERLRQEEDNDRSILNSQARTRDEEAREKQAKQAWGVIDYANLGLKALGGLVVLGMLLP